MKSQRQRLIADIVVRQPIASQEQLVSELARLGQHVNQATISRDIKALGLVKADDRYVLPGADRPRMTWDTVVRTLREHVVKIDRSHALVVVKTPPGRAHMVAVVLDGLDLPEIVGTLAGDDTILIVPRTARDLKHLFERLNEPLS
jgi:transcriptional regulator of arginine metabolism